MSLLFALTASLMFFFQFLLKNVHIIQDMVWSNVAQSLAVIEYNLRLSGVPLTEFGEREMKELI